jgi:hypothetical protein
MTTFREKLEDIAAEAKSEQDTSWEDIEQPINEHSAEWHQNELSVGEASSNDMIEPDGLEAGTVDIGSDSGKKRMHGKR